MVQTLGLEAGFVGVIYSLSCLGCLLAGQMASRLGDKFGSHLWTQSMYGGMILLGVVFFFILRCAQVGVFATLVFVMGSAIGLIDGVWTARLGKIVKLLQQRHLK